MTVKNEGLVQTISRFIEGGLMLLGFEILRLRVQNLEGLGTMNMTLPVWSENKQRNLEKHLV